MDIQAEITSSYKTHDFPQQAGFYGDESRKVIAIAGIRAGKTMGGAAKVAARIVKDLTAHIDSTWTPKGKRPMVGTDKPRSTYWVVAPSYDLVKVAWAELRSTLSAIDPLIIHESDGVVWLQTGILIQRKTGADESQLQAAKVMGVWVDEICTLPYASYLQINNRLADEQGWLVGTGSPRPDSWVKTIVWDDPDSPISKHHWATSDNPWFPADELALAKASMPDAWYRRDYEASWDTFVGVIFGEFDHEIHVVSPDEIPPAHRLSCVAGQDWGSASPGALVVIGEDTLTGDLYVVSEDYTDRLVIAANGSQDSWVQRALIAKREWAPRAYYCDVSTGDQGVYQYRIAGIPAITAKKGPGSIMDGIRVISQLLHPVEGSHPRLRISANCPNLIREIKGMCWAVNKAGQPQDRVDPDCPNHSADATKYALVGAWGRNCSRLAPRPQDTKPVSQWSLDDWRKQGQAQARLNKRMKRNRF